jgi:hypothetical protein
MVCSVKNIQRLSILRDAVFLKLRTYQICQDYLAGELTNMEVTILIPKSYRQTQRLNKEVKLQGMSGMKHGNCDRTLSIKLRPSLNLKLNLGFN